jgi:DNA-binding response OmpR family regulator
VKPFGFRELLARIRAVTRRLATPARVSAMHVGELTIDPPTRTATIGDRILELTPKEFDLLALLAREPGVVVSKQEILETVWQTSWYGSAKTIDVHVAAIRKKLGDPSLIETVRGVGLRLRLPG